MQYTGEYIIYNNKAGGNLSNALLATIYKSVYNDMEDYIYILLKRLYQFKIKV